MIRAPIPTAMNILFFSSSAGNMAKLIKYPPIRPPKWPAASTPEEKDSIIEKKRIIPIRQQTCDLLAPK